jgi:hypothetical protein
MLFYHLRPGVNQCEPDLTRGGEQGVVGEPLDRQGGGVAAPDDRTAAGGELLTTRFSEARS